jgi:hypothetical protein
MRLLSEGKCKFHSTVYERPSLPQVLLKLKSNDHLDSGTVLDSAFWGTPPCLSGTCSFFGILLVLFGCELGWFDWTIWALWGNCTPALYKM